MSDALKPDERLRVAYGHFILGITKQDLAALFAVNPGRIVEACAAIEVAMNDPLPLYQKAHAVKGDLNGDEQRPRGGDEIGTGRGKGGNGPDVVEHPPGYSG